MKRILAAFLSCAMILTGCTKNSSGSSSLSANDSSEAVSEIVSSEIPSESSSETISETELMNADYETDIVPEFMTLNDPDLLRYIDDSVYAGLDSQLGSDNYIIEDVQAIYMPEEYYAEVEFNSQENIYFGYKLSELDEVFQGTKYIFTLDDNGQTTVQEMEILYDDTYDQIIKNVAIGTGVILLCVTLSVVSGGLGATNICAIFVAAAKDAKTIGISLSVFSGVTAAATKWIETGNVKQSLKDAVLGASDGFKWGAIIGATTGGFGEYRTLKLEKSMTSLNEVIYESAAQQVDDIPAVLDIPEGRFTDVLKIPTFIETPAEFETIDIQTLSPWQLAEARAEAVFPGQVQVPFQNGELALNRPQGATIPDIIHKVGDTMEAVEVKCYNLETNLSSLKSTLKKQVAERVENLPSDYKQRIVLDVTDRGYTKEFVTECINSLKSGLIDICPDISFSVIGI